MATVLKTFKKKKAILGTINKIKEEGDSYLITIVFKNGEQAISEIPRKEFSLLGIRNGDKIRLFPQNQEECLILGSPQRPV